MLRGISKRFLGGIPGAVLVELLKISQRTPTSISEETLKRVTRETVVKTPDGTLA